MSYQPRDMFAPIAVPALRQRRGQVAWMAGHMAEDQVAAHYRDGGAEILASRWRGQAGEIDLIVRDGDCHIFVEVKRSTSHAQAALRLSRRQMDRICRAACAYCDGLATGSLTEMRFDLATVDQFGRIEVLQNAFGEN